MTLLQFDQVCDNKNEKKITSNCCDEFIEALPLVMTSTSTKSTTNETTPRKTARQVLALKKRIEKTTQQIKILNAKLQELEPIPQPATV